MAAYLGIALTCLLTVAGGDGSVVIDEVDRYRVMEPMFESVRVVLSYSGEEYSPAYIQGISGAAFRISGPCPCAPTSRHAMDTESLVNLLGYDFERLKLYGERVDPERDVHGVVARVKEEIRAGRPVIVWHAFTNAEWDVVCGFDDEKGQFLGRGSYKGQEEYAIAEETRTAKCLHICPALGAIIIGDKTGEFDAGEAELTALEEAVRHARSPRDRFLAESEAGEAGWRFRNGLACYDWWINSFRDPSKKPGMGDSYCLSVYRSTHRAASDFMLELMPEYPAAKENFQHAAESFATEADALDGCYDLIKSRSEDDQQRNAHIVSLLTEAREAYDGGITQIEQVLQKIAPERAVSANSQRPVRREGDKVWIDGVKKLSFGEGRDCTFAGALEEALLTTEHPYRYHELMGLSGLAFRVRWCNEDTKTKWGPSCSVGEMPDEQRTLSKLSGWKLPTNWLDAENRDNDSLRKKIVASIDAGRPVVAYPPLLNMGLVYGYEDGGRTLLMNDYTRDEMPSRVSIEQLGPMHTYLDDYREPPSLRDGLLESLQMAVRNWRCERHHGGLEDREYWYGDAALAAWINDLSEFGTSIAGIQKSIRGLDPWNYTTLYDARKAAVRFLNDWSFALNGEARQALKRAAELYKEETRILEPLLAEKRKPGEDQDWSEEARLRAVEVLTKARQLESAAIGEIEKVLSLQKG